MKSLVLSLSLLLLILTVCAASDSDESSDRNVFRKQPRIIGGQTANRFRYEYMVSLLSPSDEHECGGVLVAKDVVLSAAHCR